MFKYLFFFLVCIMEYQTSPMKWCESIYYYSDYIAEFWNTFTSLFFTFLPLYCYLDMKVRNISIRKKFNIRSLLFLFSLIGPTSFLFHLTLNFYAQFFDEISIIVFLIYCLKKIFKLSIYYFYIVSFLFILVSYFYPFISPFFLLTLGSSLVVTTKKQIKKDSISYKLWNKGYYYGIFAIFLWLFDFVCYFNTHSWWHIFIAYSSYHFLLVVINETCFSDEEKKKFTIVNKFFPYIDEC